MLKAWIAAFRLRTLPLALASIGMGSFLAAYENKFNFPIFILAALTTIFLQILSNLANDYGDTQNGADSVDREGPSRMVQSGSITSSQMKKAIIIFVVLSLISGIALLLVSFGVENMMLILLFLLLGLAAIGAAIKYTAGKNPYGYAGLGDISVFIFFGLVGVLGSCFLYTQSFNVVNLLPASCLGLLSTGVLNLNNIRDINSDAKAGKKSIPVRLGRPKATLYHWWLLTGAVIGAMVFTLITFHTYWQWLFLASVILFMMNGVAVQTKKNAMELDPYLKQLALSTVLFTLLFGIGLLAPY